MHYFKKTSFFLPKALTAIAFALALSAANPGTAQAAETLDKKDVENIVRSYLKSNPEIVIEAIEAYQQNQEEIEARRFQESIKDSHKAIYDKSLPFAGNPDADVTIVEFFDYNCGYCRKALNDVNKLLEKDKNVKVIFHEMPILHTSSQVAARFALAAHKQGKYFELHQAIMHMSGTKSEKNIMEEAEKLGIDTKALKKDADSKAVRKQVEDSLALSRELGIRGTPAFIIGDKLTPGYIQYQVMLDLVEKVRNEKN